MTYETVSIIEDDNDFSDFLMEYLNLKGYIASKFSSAEDFIKSPAASGCDFVIVDLGLPGLDGVDLINMISNRRSTGILVVSGRTGADAFNCALSAGADMMLLKPVRFDQVHQALQAISRRLNKSGLSVTDSSNLEEWELAEDQSALVAPDKVWIELTPVEQGILAKLMTAQGSVVDRSELSEAAGVTGGIDKRNLDAAMFRLRSKIEKKTRCGVPFRTVHGAGYRWIGPIKNR